MAKRSPTARRVTRALLNVTSAVKARRADKAQKQREYRARKRPGYGLPPELRGKGFKPMAPSLIMPSADDVRTFAQERASGPRGRQVKSLPKRKHALLAAEFPRDVDHVARHLEMCGPVIPVPTGFNIHVIMFQPPDTTAGGIRLTDNALREDRYQGKVGLVISLGPDAYQDKAKFPTGPWCKLHDWVIFPAYLDSARKFTWNGRVDILVLHDDKIDGVISDPVMLR